MKYHQLTSGERYMLSQLKVQGHNQAEIARQLGRHRSTICRELKRNGSIHDGHYRVEVAERKARTRRSRSRRYWRFSEDQFRLIDRYLKKKWSPVQISGRLAEEGLLSISHESIYRYVWEDLSLGGCLHEHLRQSPKKRRKRYNRYDSRGRLAGKRLIDERPEAIERRLRKGHWEIDTVMGSDDQHCIVTLVERKTGYVVIGKLRARTKEEAAKRTIQLIRRDGLAFETITSDNGTEFHSYKTVERATGAIYYFAKPYHSWERGSNENTNGLIRQYLPKRKSMAQVTQHQCNWIARQLNTRPRERHGFKTPEEMMYAQ